VLGPEQQPLGEVELITDTSSVQDALWLSCVEAAAAAAAAWFVAVLAMQGWRRRSAAKRAALGLAAEVEPPAGMPVEQVVWAEQVTQLQRQAQEDSVTGLPLRRHFLVQLQQRLAESGGPGAALLLVRVLHLDALNRRVGHEATDQWLRAVADVLLTYVDRVPGTFAGRLNGSDFALCLPVPGVAMETAQSLRAALAAAPALRSGTPEVAVGGVDGVHDTTGSLALAAADVALARAEDGADSGNGLVIESHAEAAPGAPLGERAWRDQIGAALEQGRTELAAEPVRDRKGRDLHLECRLRVQLTAGAAYQTADRWLALARRSRLMPQVDLAALDLALTAITTDGHPRAVHVSPVSLATPGFVGDVASRLSVAHAAARLLSIECAEGPHPGSGLPALAAAVAAWRPSGVRVGMEYAAASAQHLPGLLAAGVQYVKVDARHLQGVATEAALQGYAQSLVALLHGLGLKIQAAGIADPQDLLQLWKLGFDAASGPALQAPVATR
jgi:GGDEF domain-containing protein/EAL domain-containing protein (putative c-di-GMP-specific phosphodiesterase class I)